MMNGQGSHLKRKKSDTDEGEKDKGGERSDNDSADTVSKSMPTCSAVTVPVQKIQDNLNLKKTVIRAFKLEWKVGRHWLVYEKGLMF